MIKRLINGDRKERRGEERRENIMAKEREEKIDGKERKKDTKKEKESAW